MSSQAGSILSAGTGVVQGFMAKRTAKKAFQMQMKGLKKQEAILKETYDPARANEVSAKYDKQFTQRRLDLQREFDPELAKLREAGKKNLLAELERDDSSRQSTQVANQLFKENIQRDAAAERLKDKLFADAEAELKAGATLPPEFQAELVRSGISAATGSGFKVDQKSIGGPVASVLGSAGIALKQARQNQAMNLGNAAQGMVDARAKILSNIFPTVMTAEQTAAQRGAQAFAIGEATLPSGGLTGREALGLDIQGREGARNIRGQRLDLKAQNEITQGRILSNIVGQIGTFGGMFGSANQQDVVTGAPAASGQSGGGGSGGGMDMSSIMGIVGMFSDVDAKFDIQSINPEEILQRVLSLPVQSWRYKDPDLDHNAPHIGPMAQDFHAAFGLGASDKRIAMVDANGVLLAAVQALHHQILEQRADILELRARLANLEE